MRTRKDDKSYEIRGLKYRIYPTKKQIEIIENTFYLYSRAWNRLLYEYNSYKDELNIIPFVGVNEIFNYYTKDEIGKKNTENRNLMYFNGFLDHLIEKGKKSYGMYNLFKNNEGDYYEPYNELPSLVLSMVIDSMKKAFERMTDGSGYPKFKSYNKQTKKVIDKASFSYNYTIPHQNSDSYKFIGESNKIGFNYIDIPWGGKHKVLNKKNELVNKLIDFGELKIRLHRPFPEDHVITQYTISRTTGGRYYISFSVRSNTFNDNYKTLIKEYDVIGVDRNVKGNHVTTSEPELNNIKYNNEFLFDISNSEKEIYKKIEQSQKELSKARLNLGIKLFGESYKTKHQKIPYDKLTSKILYLKKRIGNLYEKIRNKKKDKINNIADVLTNKANTIILEDLNIKGMMKKPKPKKDETGKYIPNGKNSKSGLNKMIGRSNLYEIKLKIEQKAKQKNGLVGFVPAKNTSRTCQKCNHINTDIKSHNKNKKNKLFICESCKEENHSDFNAALNIKNKYILNVV